MARLNLRYAAAPCAIEAEHRGARGAALTRSGSTRTRSGAGRRRAAAMHVPFDEARGIHPQDDAFLEREVWDLDGTPPDHFPLLLHFHPLVIYRHQVLKQADVVLAMFLLGERVHAASRRAQLRLLRPAHDRRLVAVGQHPEHRGRGDRRRGARRRVLRFALLMDLADVAGNVSDGVHVAAAAGAWMALVFGFGGVSDFDGQLSIDPRLPRRCDGLEFSLRFHDRQLRVTLTHEEERYALDEGDPLDVTIRGEAHQLVPGSTLRLPPKPRSAPGV